MPAENNEYYPVEVELIGSIKHILQQLNQFNIEKKAWEPFGNLREKIKQSYYIGQKISQVSPLLTIENMLAVIEKHNVWRIQLLFLMLVHIKYQLLEPISRSNQID